mgnify:CR=1 FL=1
MIRIGITGQAGFIGTHLFNYLSLRKTEVEMIPFQDNFFEDHDKLEVFVGQCDAIVHLAALNRHNDPRAIYDTNIDLVRKLISAMESTGSRPHVLFSSSTQEERDNLYGRSKREGRKLFEAWAERNGAAFTGLIVPNVFGPFGRPFYNSFVPTFACQLLRNEEPTVNVDAEVRLIYVGTLCRVVLDAIRSPGGRRRVDVPWDFERKVSDVLRLFRVFKTQYAEQGVIPVLADRNDVNLFNTFRSYMELRAVKLVQHEDLRGTFIETIRLGCGGQVSFSTTVPGITRGNHYHTRKVERFSVIKGRARIQLRKIGTNEVLNFELGGDEPAYVDMPVWYTHVTIPSAL